MPCWAHRPQRICVAAFFNRIKFMKRENVEEIIKKYRKIDAGIADYFEEEIDLLTHSDYETEKDLIEAYRESISNYEGSGPAMSSEEDDSDPLTESDLITDRWDD